MSIYSNGIPRGSQHSKIECLANFLLQTRVSPHLPSKQTRAVTYTTIEMSRFATTSDAELLRIKENGHAKNTRKANERAASLLKCYLKEKNMPVNFAHFSKKELNDVLAQFYINVRQVNGEKYKVSLLENLRHALNRFLKSSPQEKDYDIIQDAEFREANMSYRAALKQLKTEGKGAVDHHPVIADKDLKLLRSSIHLNPNTPYGLYNKVQFDIRFYFLPRGA